MSSTSPSVEPSIHRTASNGVFVVAAASPNGDPAAEAAAIYARIGDVLRASRLEIVQERVFGCLDVESAVKAARATALQARGIRDDGPLSYIQGRPTWGRGLGGVIVRAAEADRVHTLHDRGIPCGRVWQADDGTFVILQSMQGLPETRGEDGRPAEQARRAMERVDRILKANGLSYRDTARTWFYLSNILAWYAEFNQTRSAKYREFGIFPEPGDESWRFPASTGILADSTGGAACTLDVLAVDGSGPAAVEFLRNPRQQEAFRYGSAFSRCAVVRGSAEDLVEISGTAAIDEHGRSVYPGDLRAQVRCTLDKIAALIKPVGASLGDICAATVFLKRGHDAEAAREVLAELGLERLPAVWVEADVCREELLFEIDAEAVVDRRR
ncbi:MAG TPA: Rid family hydrolase [Phycisphaerae bacterium]|nr:Rid family hydrolase [Phycisphaerae bacterium]HRY68697.1 Rid family hydrolase [Phycisphaerae bacterium]HSA25523.1 Rid family hydrolase [Phycisphaerae bacterium]